MKFSLRHAKLLSTLLGQSRLYYCLKTAFGSGVHFVSALHYPQTPDPFLNLLTVPVLSEINLSRITGLQWSQPVDCSASSGPRLLLVRPGQRGETQRSSD